MKFSEYVIQDIQNSIIFCPVTEEEEELEYIEFLSVVESDDFNFFDFLSSSGRLKQKFEFIFYTHRCSFLDIDILIDIFKCPKVFKLMSIIDWSINNLYDSLIIGHNELVNPKEKKASFFLYCYLWFNKHIITELTIEDVLNSYNNIFRPLNILKNQKIDFYWKTRKHLQEDMIQTIIQKMEIPI